MNTIDKLNKIKSECKRLLALAEKRTPEKWTCPNTRTEVFMIDSRLVAMCNGPETSAHSNAAFIAACAGPAEAGWRSTITVIEFYLNSNGISQVFLYELICEILTAWEGLV